MTHQTCVTNCTARLTSSAQGLKDPARQLQIDWNACVDVFAIIAAACTKRTTFSRVTRYLHLSHNIATLVPKGVQDVPRVAHRGAGRRSASLNSGSDLPGRSSCGPRLQALTHPQITVLSSETAGSLPVGRGLRDSTRSSPASPWPTISASAQKGWWQKGWCPVRGGSPPSCFWDLLLAALLPREFDLGIKRNKHSAIYIYI